jgi:GWxTD domain-containing protein
MLYSSIAKSFDLGAHLLSEIDKEKTDLYKKGISSLADKDTLQAEKYFKESIRKHSDASSYFELAKIYLHRNTFHSRNMAYENLRKAAWGDPNNLEIRYAFANLMRDFARVNSFDEYKKILAIDSTQVDAWLHLGELKAQDFSEYNNSVRDMGEMYGSLQEYADEDFAESEKYLLQALQYDSLNNKAIMQLCKLYDNAGTPIKSIPLLKRLVENNKGIKEVHELLGLFYYKTSKMKEAFSEYQTAIQLMQNEEREDFLFNSAKLLLENSFEEVFENYSDGELKEFINVYWKITDPLFLTDYNERLLEHYSRIAYANLNYTVPEVEITGWKSNMGETILRYGEPKSKMRIRPQFGEGKIGMKTEVWNYGDFNLAFTDIASNGNFKYAWPSSEKDKFAPQVTGNYQDIADNLKRILPVYYLPKFEGPKIDVPFTIAQFKSLTKRNNTDLYLAYNLVCDDSLFKKADIIENKIGFFFFDREYEEQFKKIKTTSVANPSNSTIVDFVDITTRPDSGYISFETIRNVDNGTSSVRSPLTIKKFSNNNLDLSSIVFANDISFEKNNDSYFERNKIFIEPNPVEMFRINQPVHLYYEIYNLTKDERGITNFEQSVTISEFDPDEKTGIEQAVSSLLNFLGFARNEKITLTSNYQTLESNPQIYFQLDFSNYEPGHYLVSVKIKDKLSGAESIIEKPIGWRMHEEN